MELTRRSLLVSGTALAATPAEPLRLPRALRMALIGFDGHVAEILNPLPRLPQIEIAAIASPDPKVLEKQARNPRLAGAKRYGDYRRLLDSERVDLVSVCNPNGERAEAVISCLERKLHVIAEKPLALTRKDLDRIDAVRKKYNL